MFKKIAFSILFVSTTLSSQEQLKDSLKTNPFNYKSILAPSILIGYGIIGIESDYLKGFNAEIKEEVNENIDQKLTIDDFIQYLPAASVYGLNVIGIEGKHDFKERSIILATSYLLVSGTVLGLKTVTHVERPDGSSYNSFPSGHTATAFAGAEFLWQEYKDQSIWYGVSGYIIATGTGLFRIYNDRHWFTDVAAGAGIGILCTKTAYWLYPRIQEMLFKKETTTAVEMAPFYNGKQYGIGLNCRF